MGELRAVTAHVVAAPQGQIVLITTKVRKHSVRTRKDSGAVTPTTNDTRFAYSRSGIPYVPNDLFDFRYEDLIVETHGIKDHAVCIITHKPTGITVEGHDNRAPGSVMGARKDAMKKLRAAVETNP